MRFCEGVSTSMLSLSPRVVRNDDGGAPIWWRIPDGIRCDDGDAMFRWEEAYNILSLTQLCVCLPGSVVVPLCSDFSVWATAVCGSPWCSTSFLPWYLDIFWQRSASLLLWRPTTLRQRTLPLYRLSFLHRRFAEVGVLCL